ncbi:MAG: hypothetical protein IKL85_07595 [Lentisphaeria bacterium]|nr:hypothetical protein [Lentisphaeria bacterium]
METSIAYLDYDKAVVSTDEAKWHRYLRRLREQYPDQVRIKYEPENNDGNMVAEIPVKWVKIKPPKRMNYSDEQLAAMSEKMRNRASKPDDTSNLGTNEEDSDE